MKKGIYLTILILITIVCILIGSAYHIGGFFRNLFTPFEKDHVSFETDLDAFSSIVIDADTIDITIQSGSDYHLEYYCMEACKPEYEINKQTLTIKQTSKDQNFFGKNNSLCELKITVPSDVTLNELNITSDVGEVSLQRVESESLILNCDVGDIELTNSSFSLMQVNANVGDVNLENITCADGVITADVGDIDIEHITFDNLEITCDVGDVEITSKSTLSDYKIALDADLGSISFQDEDYSDSYTQKGKSGFLSIETNTGDIEVDD